MPSQVNCTILELTRLNDTTYSMTIAAAGIAAELTGPGCFLHIRCGEERLLRRPISICSWEGERIRIVFEVRGEGTAWLAARTVGETVDVLGPLGRGFRLQPGDRPLLVAGGIGSPPMLSCAEFTGGGAEAVLGFREASRAILVEDFQKTCRAVSLASDDGSLGTKGFVDALVRDRLSKPHTFTAVLACGPKPMLRAVARVAEQFGVPCQVSLEERMGCGVGACLVCACKTADGAYRHVCKDGPVFEASEVDWDA